MLPHQEPAIHTEGKPTTLETDGLADKNHELEAKKPYATPELTVHRTVEEITKSAGQKGADAVIGSRLL